jgi:hypothetical protein
MVGGDEGFDGHDVGITVGIDVVGKAVGENVGLELGEGLDTNAVPLESPATPITNEYILIENIDLLFVIAISVREYHEEPPFFVAQISPL